jgi:hypothetical protein
MIHDGIMQKCSPSSKIYGVSRTETKPVHSILHKNRTKPLVLMYNARWVQFLVFSASESTCF